MNSPKLRLLRVTTVPISLKLLLSGQPAFFMKLGFEVLTVSADGPEVAALKKDGVRHSVVPMTRQITPFADMFSLLRLISVIRTFQPDIVHTHTPKAGLLGMLAAWFCRVPVRMHTVAGLPLMVSSGFKRKLLIAVERVTYMCATTVYPNSLGLKDFIEKNIPTRTPLKIIGKGSTNGIQVQRFTRTAQLQEEAIKIRNQIGVETNDIVFSFVGRVVRDKGIAELVQAFRNLTNNVSHSKIKLLIIGHFEQQLDPLNASDFKFLNESPDVYLAGFQDDIRPWVIASDVFVFPSYREGFPNVVLQACALEVPCIVSDINGCNEIIAHEDSGLVVPPGNSAALEVAMRRMMTEHTLRSDFAKRARTFVSENFDQPFVWNELLKEYKTVITKKKTNE